MGNYNPGEATAPVKIGEGRYSIDSFRGEAKSYEVTISATSCTCTCPHYVARIAGTDGQCKHIKACIEMEASQPQPTNLQRAAAVAETLPDTDLQKWAAEKQGTAAGCACLLVLAKRQAADQREAELKAMFS